MGNLVSTPSEVEDEKLTWAIPHELERYHSLRIEHMRQIEELDPDLRLCSAQRNYGGLFSYEHWFITDGLWFVEFGSGSRGDEPVRIHQDSSGFGTTREGVMTFNYLVHESFRLTPEIKQRLLNICGVHRFSICLRNSEHLCRYIFSGSWISFQTSSTGVIREYFKSYGVEDHSSLFNTLPRDLKTPWRVGDTNLYAECSLYIRYCSTEVVLNRNDPSCYSILFLGPTGSGKSHLINILFNQEVCRTSSAARSETKEIEFIRGEYQHFSNENRRFAVNVIDTIGLCDSMMTSEDVFSCIKDRVKVNFVFVDVVVVVCSARIEREQADAIKRYLQWLDYKKHPQNFIFIYNKAEVLTEAEKTLNLMQMGEMLELDTSSNNAPFFDTTEGGRRVIQTRFATGFPPHTDYTAIRGDRKKLTDAVFMDHPDRLRVEESSCVIL